MLITFNSNINDNSNHSDSNNSNNRNNRNNINDSNSNDDNSNNTNDDNNDDNDNNNNDDNNNDISDKNNDNHSNSSNSSNSSRSRARAHGTLTAATPYRYTPFTTNKSTPIPLSRPRYDIFSWAVHIDRPYGAVNIFHTGGSVVGVGLAIVVLNHY